MLGFYYLMVMLRIPLTKPPARLLFHAARNEIKSHIFTESLTLSIRHGLILRPNGVRFVTHGMTVFMTVIITHHCSGISVTATATRGAGFSSYVRYNVNTTKQAPENWSTTKERCKHKV